MYRYYFLLLSLLIIAGCQDTSDSSSEKAAVADKQLAVEKQRKKHQNSYKPFPKGYGYMKNLKALQSATEQGDREVIRHHAWKLWAGIMQPDEKSGWPLWYSWPNTTAAFKPEKKSNLNSDDSTVATPVGESIRKKNKKNSVSVSTPAPVYDVPQPVIDNYPTVATKTAVKDGKHFQFNGDIMVATESLSREAMENIRKRKLFLKSTLDLLHKKKKHNIDLSKKFIVTKHMYWPVKANGVTGVPVWNNDFPDSFTGYAGYEKWNTLIGINPGGEEVGKTVAVEYLYGVLDHEAKKPIPTITRNAKVYGLDDFYYHQITQADWDSFDEADKAILNAASYWANNQAIGVGDYLVSIAMHVNTKELSSWTLQSVWWSDKPNQGQYAQSRPEMPKSTAGPWYHYLLTDAYAVPPNAKGELDIAVNPYIEGVSHPIATNCRNCHVRGGWPQGSTAGKASYQNPNCPGLLTYLTPESTCLNEITLTDYTWIIPDRAVSE